MQYIYIEYMQDIIKGLTLITLQFSRQGEPLQYSTRHGGCLPLRITPRQMN